MIFKKLKSVLQVLINGKAPVIDTTKDNDGRVPGLPVDDRPIPSKIGRPK